MNIKLKDIEYHLTSRLTKPNEIMRKKILPFFISNNVKKILDYGCGKYLRDAIFFSENGLIVDAVDLKEQIQRIAPEKIKKVNSVSDKLIYQNYDAVLLNFVLQVLPAKKQREVLLKKVCSAVKIKGYLVVSLRNNRDIINFVEKRGKPFKDGFIMGKKGHYTFVRGYEKAEIEKLLNKYNLMAMVIFKTASSLIIISQKTK